MPTQPVHCGDAREWLARGCPEHFDLCLWDPPYNIGYDYPGYRDNLPLHEYVTFIREVAQGLRGRGRPGAVVAVLCAARLSYAVHGALAAGGLDYHRTLIWAYTFGQNQLTDYTGAYVPIHLFRVPSTYPAGLPGRVGRGKSSSRKARYTFNVDAVRVPSWRAANGDPRCADARGKTPPDVVEPAHLAPDLLRVPRLPGNARERVPGATAQLPLALCARLVLAHSNPGELVVDPTAGWGSTLVAAAAAGRRVAGCELHPGTARIANGRIVEVMRRS